MNAVAAPDLTREYLAWLKDRLHTIHRGEISVLSTPFLDPFHDGIEVCMDHSGGELILHDDGRTLDNLLDLGIQIEKSERRQQIIQHAIAGCGVEWVNGRLQTIATPDSLAQRAHFLLTAISRLNDLWMSAAPRSAGDFFALVKEYLDERNAHYIANVPIPGRTVAHHMDFVVSLGRGKERLVKLVSSPSVQAAKLVSFAWMELRDSRGDSERVVVLNDMSIPDSLSDEEEPMSRNVSEQAVAILQAYSHQVLSWSARNDEQFDLALVA